MFLPSIRCSLFGHHLFLLLQKRVPWRSSAGTALASSASPSTMPMAADATEGSGDGSRYCPPFSPSSCSVFHVLTASDTGQQAKRGRPWCVGLLREGPLQVAGLRLRRAQPQALADAPEPLMEWYSPPWPVAAKLESKPQQTSHPQKHVVVNRDPNLSTWLEA